jgi:hypothetical protein
MAHPGEFSYCQLAYSNTGKFKGADKQLQNGWIKIKKVRFSSVAKRQRDSEEQRTQTFPQRARAAFDWVLIKANKRVKERHGRTHASTRV